MLLIIPEIDIIDAIGILDKNSNGKYWRAKSWKYGLKDNFENIVKTKIAITKIMHKPRDKKDIN